MAKFFKSTTFKCVSVLLAIILVSGLSIAILSDLLFVSPEERTSRALEKIYGKPISASEYTVLLDVDSDDAKLNKAIETEFGQIEKIFRVGDENQKHDMIFRTTGKEGYKGGTFTMWIKVVVDGVNLNIDKVIIDGNTKQTLMSKLGDSYLNGFNGLIDISNEYDTYFYSKDGHEKSNPVSGATMSAQAGCNAVNCVIKYLKGGN